MPLFRRFSATTIVSIAAVVLIVAYVGYLTYQWRPTSHVTQVAPDSESERAFTQLCSNIKEDAGSIGYVFCLGKLRGFADGHMITADTARYLFPADSDGVKLWCIDPAVTNHQLYTAVYTWIRQNGDTVDAIVERIDSNELFTAIMIAAFNASYPCTEKKHVPNV